MSAAPNSSLRGDAAVLPPDHVQKAPSLQHRAREWLCRKPEGGLPLYRRTLLCGLLGLTMGTLFDYLHVYNQVAGYSSLHHLPGLKVAWYVPIEFTVAGMVVGTVRPELDEELNRPRSHLGRATVLWGIAMFSLAWWGSGALSRADVAPSAIASVLALLGVGVWAVLDGTRQGAIAAGLTAVLGVAVEAAITWTGTYWYSEPDLGPVPQWLPGLYVTACVAVGNIGRYMKYSWYSPRAPEREIDDRAA